METADQRRQPVRRDRSSNCGASSSEIGGGAFALTGCGDPEKRFFVTAVTSPAHIPQVNIQGSPSRNYTPARAPRPTALRSRGLRSVGENFTSNQSRGIGACCRGGELVSNYAARIKLAADNETIQETNCGLETQQHHGNRFWSRYWLWLQHH